MPSQIVVVGRADRLSNAAGYFEAHHVRQEQFRAGGVFFFGKGQSRGQECHAGVTLHSPCNVVVVQGVAHSPVYQSGLRRGSLESTSNHASSREPA